jgi:hypothetical protein
MFLEVTHWRLAHLTKRFVSFAIAKGSQIPFLVCDPIQARQQCPVGLIVAGENAVARLPARAIFHQQVPDSLRT